jgi:hypothetical protein
MSESIELNSDLAWIVYDNINKKLADSTLPAGDLANYQELLDGFLSNEIFGNALSAGLPDDDLALSAKIKTETDIANKSLVTATSSTAYYLVDDMLAGNPSNLLSDLIDGYTPPETIESNGEMYGRDVGPDLAGLLEAINAEESGSLARFLNEERSPDSFTKLQAEAVVITLENATDRLYNEELDHPEENIESAQTHTKMNFSLKVSDYMSEVAGYHIDKGEGFSLNSPAIDETAQPTLVSALPQPEAFAAAAAPLVTPEPAPAAGPLSREQIIERLKYFQAMDETVTLDTYQQGLEALNSDYGDVFDAVEKTGGTFVNSLQDQLEKGLNESPEILNTLIEISASSEQLSALTEAIGTEAGATDLVYALAQANGEAPHSINPHAATPLPSEGPDIPEISEIIDHQIVMQTENIDMSPEIPQEEDTAPAIQTPIALATPFATAVAYTPVEEVSANINAAPSSTPYTVKDADTSLTQIMHEHYGIEDPNMAYRASLIVASANDMADANVIHPGDELSLPTLETLQEISGTDDLRLKNLSSHPDEIGKQVKTAMADNAPVGGGYAYLEDDKIAAAPMTLG